MASQGFTTTQESASNKAAIYVGVVILLGAVVAIAFYTLGQHSKPIPPVTVSTTGTTTTNTTALAQSSQSTFVNDLQKLSQTNALYISYSAGSTTSTVTSGSTRIDVAENQSIASYKLGQSKKSLFITSVTETNQSSGKLINATKDTVIFFSNSTGDLTCINQTTYYLSSTNTSLQCYPGDGGIVALHEFPFNLSDTGSISNLLAGGSLSYQGVQKIGGRQCDYFTISNQATDPENFTSINICLDTEYGLPLYSNTSIITGLKITHNSVLAATGLSANVTAQEVAAPQAYLNHTSVA